MRVKVCGVTRVDDALASVDAGADAIGLNFWEPSPRHVAPRAARAIADAVRGRTLIVGVFVDATLDEIRRVRDEVGLECVQLHGDEPPELLAQLLPHAYKALRAGDASVIDRVRAYPGEHVLLDASVPGMPGGTGRTFDWALARGVARERKLTLAGGLLPENVAAAVALVQPYCVDVASGVEVSPGRKDLARMRAFVAAARGAGP